MTEKCFPVSLCGESERKAEIQNKIVSKLQIAAKQQMQKVRTSARKPSALPVEAELGKGNVLAIF